MHQPIRPAAYWFKKINNTRRLAFAHLGVYVGVCILKSVEICEFFSFFSSWKVV